GHGYQRYHFHHAHHRRGQQASRGRDLRRRGRTLYQVWSARYHTPAQRLHLKGTRQSAQRSEERRVGKECRPRSAERRVGKKEEKKREEKSSRKEKQMSTTRCMT